MRVLLLALVFVATVFGDGGLTLDFDQAKLLSASISVPAGTPLRLCQSGCKPARDPEFHVEMKVHNVTKCAGAQFDPREFEKNHVRKGERYTGKWIDLHWGNGYCEVVEDEACPKEFNYFAFLVYDCEERNGTKYYKAHSYEKLHKLLSEF